MSWNRLLLVTDADLGNLEPEATSSDRPWKNATWPKQRAEAKRDLKIWIDTDFPQIPGASDRIIDRWNPAYVFQYTGGSYTDVTSAARDDNEEDVALATALANAATDKIYIGAPFEFEGIAAKLLDHVNAVSSVLTVKYWSGNQWVTAGASDATNLSGKTFAQSGRIMWTLPTDWERRRLNGTGEEYFWVELSVSVALTAGTKATQLLPVREPDALKRIACYLSLYHILNGLAQAAAEPDRWEKKAQGYWDRAVGLYAAVKGGHALWLDLSSNDVIEPAEQQQGRGGVTFGRA